MNKVFAVICNQTPELRSIKFFATLLGAQKHLKSLAEERKNKLGVYYFQETEDKFSFALGWEGYNIIFSIVELPVAE